MTDMNTILYFPASLKAAAQDKLTGAKDSAARCGVHVQVVASEPTFACVRELAALWRPVGAIVDCAGAWGDLNPRVFGMLPTVMLGHSPETLPCDTLSVLHDSTATAHAAARELLALGRTSFAYVHSPEHRHWSETRGRVFAEDIALHGFPCRVLAADEHGEKGAAWQRRLRAFLRTLPRPCALFAANDDTAAEVLASARFEGVSVPDDLAVLGVNNHVSICERTEPTLSSVAPDFHRAGVLAAELLFEAVGAKKPLPLSARTVMFGDLRIVRRTSTRPLATVDACAVAAQELIRREACTGLRPARVAALFPCSRRMADIRFRKAAGRSIGEEIAAVRLETAQRLLASTHCQIKVLPDFCGFVSAGALRKFFRRRTGASLTAWRQNPLQS